MFYLLRAAHLRYGLAKTMQKKKKTKKKIKSFRKLEDFVLIFLNKVSSFVLKLSQF